MQRRSFLKGLLGLAATGTIVSVAKANKPEPQFGRYESVRYIESPAQRIADNGVSLEEIKVMQSDIDKAGGEIMPELWSKKFLNEFYDNCSLAINK